MMHASARVVETSATDAVIGAAAEPAPPPTRQALAQAQAQVQAQATPALVAQALRGVSSLSVDISDSGSVTGPLTGRSFLDDALPRRGAGMTPGTARFDDDQQLTPRGGMTPRGGGGAEPTGSAMQRAGAHAYDDGPDGVSWTHRYHVDARSPSGRSSLRPSPAVAAGTVRGAQAAAHKDNNVIANVFNRLPSDGSFVSSSLKEHPSFYGAAGMASDSDAAQSHPELPGVTRNGVSGTPRRLPGAQAAATLGQAAEDFITGRAQEQGAPAAAAPRSAFPWEPELNVAPDRPAPPKEYAACSASLAERARFRGVKRVENQNSYRESNPGEPGGVLSQAGFPEPAPKRWDDQLFESRLKHAITPGGNAMGPKGTPRGGGGSSAGSSRRVPSSRVFKR